MAKKVKKVMNAIEAAFNGLGGTESKEYKRFMEDLRTAGEDALRTHTNKLLKQAERDLEDVQYALEQAQAELDAAKRCVSEEAISEEFVKALKDCKKKGARQTFEDVVNAINPNKNEDAIKAAEAKVKKAQEVVDDKQKIVDNHKQVIEVIKAANDRLFKETVEVEVDTESEE